MAENAFRKTQANHFIRLDPYQNFHRLQIGDKQYRLDRKGAIVHQQLNSGLPISISVPAKVFKGVAARAVEDKSGHTTVTLELLHHDPELCIPLLCENDMNYISADWHSWSRLMRLPMLILDLDCKPTPVQRMLGELLVMEPIKRRKRITSIRQRPAFPSQRRPGNGGKSQMPQY